MQSFWLGTLLPSTHSDAEDERGNCGQAAQEGNTGRDVLSAESPAWGGRRGAVFPLDSTNDPESQSTYKVYK